MLSMGLLLAAGARTTTRFNQGWIRSAFTEAQLRNSWAIRRFVQ